MLTDPDSGRQHTIDIDPRLSPQQNAQIYFAKYKQRKRKQEHHSQNEARVRERIKAIEQIVDRLPDMGSAELRQALDAVGGDTRRGAAAGAAAGTGRGTGAARESSAGRAAGIARAAGMEFYSHGFTILVGKSAADSDRLMRSTVNGNDVWTHARGVTGSSVFIRYRKGKSVPLEVLYDAATLAHHFSKARGNGHIDVHYTEVKHLRRAKHAPQGTFIPFHDHGLALAFDAQRLERLQAARNPD